jgi:acetate kinase
MQVLVINSGSSSIKFRLVHVVEEPEGGLTTQPALFQGAIRGIGSVATFEVSGHIIDRSTTTLETPDHAHAMRALLARLAGSLGQVEAVGHRVVHGGDRYVESTLVTEQVEAGIDALSELAPLHNPPCLAGIREARATLGMAIPMVAVFDTAFHQTMPPVASHYALPTELTERHRIRRYGFHGIAHASLANGYMAHSGTPLEQVRLITLQLGNGCSIAAIAQGRSVETSMGLTPLEGLVMGTRSGDVDASIVNFLSEREKVSPAEVERWLNERSGLLGLSGRSHDMRELLRLAEQERDTRAEFAIDLFCYRVRKYLGAYLAVLEGADAVVFGGGIGENAPEIRERICRNMKWCGLELNSELNRGAVGFAQGHAAKISMDGSRLPTYMVAADEESWIATETFRCVRSLQ